MSRAFRFNGMPSACYRDFLCGVGGVARTGEALCRKVLVFGDLRYKIGLKCIVKGVFFEIYDVFALCCCRKQGESLNLRCKNGLECIVKGVFFEIYDNRRFQKGTALSQMLAKMVFGDTGPQKTQHTLLIGFPSMNDSRLSAATSIRRILVSTGVHAMCGVITQLGAPSRGLVSSIGSTQTTSVP